MVGDGSAPVDALLAVVGAFPDIVEEENETNTDGVDEDAAGQVIAAVASAVGGAGC